MKREAIFEELKGILKNIKPNIDLSSVSDDSQLIRDLGLDSLIILLLSLAVENQFGFTFEGTPKFNTVGEVVDYIETHTNK